MNILDEIVSWKKQEVSERKELIPTKKLEQSIYYPTKTVSLKEYVLRSDKSGIIAEIKRKSPSAGIINGAVSVERTSIGYMMAGASALSVLTDTKYFGGSNEDLIEARKFNYCPILRKEFIIDEYQVIEAKSIGADAILLIAAILTENQLQQLMTLAHDLGMEVLVEVHKKEEIYDVLSDSNLVGVNNRNLDTFEVSIETSESLFEHLPESAVKVSESGISRPEYVQRLLEVGYRGFLIGGSFMQDTRPEHACRRFIREIRTRIPA